MIKIAVAHLKGGVGKSSTTLFLAEHWALAGDRVLVIDLDPQSNASFMLLSREHLSTWEDGKKTLPDLLRDLRSSRKNLKLPKVDVATYLVPRCSDLVELHRGGMNGLVSILPSIPRLWFEEYEFDKECHQQNCDPVQERVAILQDALLQLEGLYDFVIMDCPPGFGSLARAGVLLADHIIAPTIADYVSVRSLHDFFELGLRQPNGLDLRVKAHIVVSKYTNSNFQKSVLDLLRANYKVVLPPVKMLDDVLLATENIAGRTRTYRQKYPDTIARHIEPMTRAVKAAILATNR